MLVYRRATNQYAGTADEILSHPQRVVRLPPPVMCLDAALLCQIEGTHLDLRL